MLRRRYGAKRNVRRNKRRNYRKRGMYNKKRIANIYRYKRFGQSSEIVCGVGGTAGTIALTSTGAGVTGWALATSPSLDANGTYQFGGAMQFQLNQIISPTDFQLLYDKYKINGVKVTFIPLGTATTNATTQSLASTNYATIAIAVDNDDASLPGSWDLVAAKQDCKIRRLSKPVSVYVRNPKIAQSIYDGVVSAYSPTTGWIDMNYDGVPHYGLKYYIRDCPLPASPTAGNGANVMFRIVTKFYFSMKDPQ